MTEKVSKLNIFEVGLVHYKLNCIEELEKLKLYAEGLQLF